MGNCRIIPHLSRCCFCNSLRSGLIGLGKIMMLFSFITLALQLYALEPTKKVIRRVERETELIYLKYLRNDYILILTHILFLFLGLIILRGAKTQNKCLLVIFTLCEFLLTIIFATCAVYLALGIDDVYGSIDLHKLVIPTGLFTVTTIFAVLSLYFAVVTRSYLREIHWENEREVNTKKYRFY
uniref:CSON013819 protein n=1 Tax=Culicoides sonorensis TaxID=179676 RepID=A0A336M956_CULSO